jgi:hypothetical protein
MPKNFYELEEVAQALDLSIEEVEEMISLRELPVVSISTRRLVQTRELEALFDQVRSGGPARTRKEFRAKTVDLAVREASASLGVAPKGLAYEVLERGTSRVPGLSPRGARIMVDLLATAENADGRDPETPAAAEEQRPGSSVSPPAVEVEKRAGTAGDYYAPGQVARLLDRDLYEINLWIYTRKIPVVNINDYRWVPREAVDGLLSELSPRKLEDPPKPFRILRSPEQEADNQGDRLGRAEITDQLRITPDLLRQRIEELEGQVKALRSELEAERSHRAQGSESERDDPVVRH